MTVITAALIHSENNWTITDITVINLEYLINNAIRHINFMAGTTITELAAGTVTMTANESAVVRALTVLLTRAYLDRGPNTAIGSLNVTSIIADPQFKVFSDLYKEALEQLKVTTGNYARSFVTT